MSELNEVAETEETEGCDECGEDFDAEIDTPVTGDPFFYHKVTPENSEDMGILRRDFRAIRANIEEFCPDCEDREQAVFFLRLAMNFAIAAIACCGEGNEAVS